MEKIKELRRKSGMSQEELAEKTGLSLRTIQRIENMESVPNGDTLKKLAAALGVSPGEIFLREDRQYLKILNLSGLALIVHPFLGVIAPLILWMYKKDEIKDVGGMGKDVVNFQITWFLLFFLTKIILLLSSPYILAHFALSFDSVKITVPTLGSHFSSFTLPSFLPYVLYVYCLILILWNQKRIDNNLPVKYTPKIRFFK